MRRKSEERYVEKSESELIQYIGPPLDKSFAQLSVSSDNALVLSLFNLSHFFQVVSGGDVGISKTQQLAGLLDDGSIGPDSIMVGDRKFDLIAARDNELESIAVLWGYGSYQELDREVPTMILEEPRQLSEKSTLQTFSN